jgi:iron complex transport system permease protein
MRKKTIQILALVLTLITFFFLPFLSGTPIHPFHITAEDYQILMMLRIPRLLLAILAGGGLALVGLVFQSLFRNPLASPYTLGVASGATFFIVLFVQIIHVSNLWIQGGSILFAFFGGNLSIFLIYFLSRKSGFMQTHRMILSGVALTYFFSGLISLFLYYSNYTDVFQILRWMMGGLDVIGFGFLKILLPIEIVCGILLFLLMRPVYIMSTSHEFAYAKGVDVQKYQKWVFWLASFLTAAIVSFTGPIAFIGLMVPHMIRLLFGNNLQKIFLVTFLGGGLFLSVIDTTGTFMFYPLNFPVGILTGLLGAPFFFWLLIRESRKIKA